MPVIRRQGQRSGAPIANLHGRRALPATGFHNLTKSDSDVSRIVAELTEGELTKEQRLECLRALAKSGDDVPDELMDQALRKLMERITE